MKNKGLLYFWDKKNKSLKSSSTSSPSSRESPIHLEKVVSTSIPPEEDTTIEEEPHLIHSQQPQEDDASEEKQIEDDESEEDESEEDESEEDESEDDESEDDTPTMHSQDNKYPVYDIDLLPHDRGTRIPISSYPINDQDAIKRGFIVKKACQPKPKEGLPQTKFGGKMRRFSINWYKKYDWLEYSVEKDAAFCLVCYLFANETSTAGGDAFGNGGWKSWNKPERLERHVGGLNSTHNDAKVLFDHFVDQKTSIVQKLESISNETKILYKSRLTYLLSCLRFLLQQGMSFRGHDESALSLNKGNFRELLKWLAGNSEKIAKVVLAKAPKNHQVVSPDIQKDLITCCAKETIRLILDDIDGNVFGILADESSDVSYKEQLAICLRYVDKKGKVCERFLGVVKVVDTTSLTIKTAIVSLLGEYGLLVSSIRGQGYDGASNMRGDINGLKTMIMKESPSAYYIHCFAHQLQLTLVAVAKDNQDCATFYENLGYVINIIGVSCKRLELVRNIQARKILKALELKEIKKGKGKNQLRGLSRPGATRWGSHLKSVLTLMSMYSTIIEVLVIVGNDNKNGGDSIKAQIAVAHLESFEFVFMLHLMKMIFGYTNELCDALQRKEQDIINAMSFVSLTKEHLQRCRDHGWDEFLVMVTMFCEKHDIEIPNMNDFYVPHGRSRRFFAKVNNLHRYRVEMYLSVIDLQLQELNNRFDEVSMELLLCMTCLNPINSFASFDKKKLMRLAEFYPQEFSSVDIMSLDFQLDIFVSDMRKNAKFGNIKSLGELSMKLVESNKHVAYPLVYLLLKLVLILPVATASVERAFSAMTFVKNKLRNI